MTVQKASTTIDGYLAALTKEKKAALQKLRKVIKSVAPDMKERMSGGAPFFWHRGRRAVGFGAAKEHLSFFIMQGDVLKAHRGDLKAYDVSSTVVHFTPDKPLPVGLITKLVKARIAEIDRTLKKKSE